MRTLIIGAGPAGLLAAHGAATSGSDVVIFDANPMYRPNTIFSLQYLHEPCGLELAIRSFDLTYSTTERSWPGYNQEYARIRYNRKLGRPDEEDNSTRFLFDSPVRVWSLRDAYRTLWHIYKGKIRIQGLDWRKLLEFCSIYDVVISTAPLPKLLPDLSWPTRDTLIVMDWLPYEIAEDTCVYSLDPDVPWYRATNLDRGQSTEFVRDAGGWGESKLDMKVLRKVAQHSNVVGPMPHNLWLTGRWGSWDPTKLTHHAYQDARRAVQLAKGSVRPTS